MELKNTTYSINSWADDKERLKLDKHMNEGVSDGWEIYHYSVTIDLKGKLIHSFIWRKS